MRIQDYPIQILKEKIKSAKDKRVYQRLQIILFLRKGERQREISAELNVSVGIVPYWKKRFEKEGLTGLQDKSGRGRKYRISKSQITLLEKSIENGITMKDNYKRGFKTKDVREFIFKEFKIEYTPRNCRKILHKLRFNLKVPRPRNKSRNQNAIDKFKEEFKKNSKFWIKER